MATYQPAKKNTAYITYLSLISQADPKLFQVNPTLAAGDVKVSIDGAAEADLATLPVVTPAGSKRVKVSLSSSEMNGDNIQITFSDAAGAQWCDATINIPTAARQIDDLLPTATYSAPPSAASIATAVWDSLTSALSVANSIGKLLVDNINATIGSRFPSVAYTIPPTVIEIWHALLANITTPNSIGKLLKDNIDAAITSRMATFVYTTPPTVIQVVNGVWDELLSSHSLAGTFGNSIQEWDVDGIFIHEDGLNNIIDTAPVGAITTWKERVAVGMRHLTNKSRRDISNGNFELFNDAGTSVLYTRAYTVDATQEIVNGYA